MSSETEKQTAASAQSAAGSEKKAPETPEERLLNLDANASKKALHDSRVLKRLGILFIALGVLALLIEPLLIVTPRLPGFASWGAGLKRSLLQWTILLPFVIVGAPAFGYALRHCRSTLAQWLFRVVAILMIVEGVLEMIDLSRDLASAFREAGPHGLAKAVSAVVGHPFFGGFIGELVSVLISIRLCCITYNDILFGPNPPSHNQLGYVRSKWKAGEKPDHIPEHVHKPWKYAGLCFGLAFLMLPVCGFKTYRSILKQIEYSHAQENFQAGMTLFAEAGQAADPRTAEDKYGEAYRHFRIAESDPVIREVHKYLGLCLVRGLGCKPNYREAFVELTRFPDITDSDAEAQFLLAMLNFHGRGTDQNIEKAAELLLAAARKGQLNAKAFLGYDMTDEATASKEPDFGGQTAADYLKAKSEQMKNDGVDSFEDDIRPIPPPPEVIKTEQAGPGQRPAGNGPDGPASGKEPQTDTPAVQPGSAPAQTAPAEKSGSDGAPAAVPVAVPMAVPVAVPVAGPAEQ